MSCGGQLHAAPLGLKTVPFERVDYKPVAPTELAAEPNSEVSERLVLGCRGSR